MLLSTYGSRGDVEPLAGLAVRLRALGRPFPPEVTDNRMLWDLDAQSNNALFGEALNTNRASIGLPPVPGPRAREPAPRRYEPEPATARGSVRGMATRPGTPVQTPRCAQWPQATPDRS
jgi:hypothetical protein